MKAEQLDEFVRHIDKDASHEVTFREIVQVLIEELEIPPKNAEDPSNQLKKYTVKSKVGADGEVKDRVLAKLMPRNASAEEKSTIQEQFGNEGWIDVVDISVIIKAMKSHPGFKDTEPDPEDEQ